WAVASMEFAYNQGLITEDDLLDAKRDITRIEFCKIVVLLYEKNKGEKLIPRNKSPFTDCDDAAVISAYEAGIISGTEPTKFQPNDTLTREQLAIMLNRILKNWDITLKAGTKKYAFPDITVLMQHSIDVINKVKAAGILVGEDDGKFYPMRGLTFEEAVIGLVKTCHYAEKSAEVVEDKTEGTEQKSISAEAEEPLEEKQASNDTSIQNETPYNTVYIKDKKISLEETSKQLIGDWGNPDRIDSTVYGLKRYVYIGNYENYFFVTLKDDKIIEVFVPTKNFSYLGTDGDGTSVDIKQIDYISLVEHSAIIETEATHAGIPLDYEGTIRGLLLQDREFAYGNSEKSGLTAAERITLGTELLDLIQVKRKEQGVPLLTEIKKLSSVAMAHSKDMVDNKYFSYTGQDGSSPFTRIQAEKIFFTSALEVIAKQRGDVTDVYQQWIRTGAQFQALLDPTMDSAGVGVAQSAKDLYVTIDLCGGIKE
ncbi:MAG: S-layer homology domain-containing protein, partial [Anaerotignum sp.]|nr:S-layer homology domain-containing protein [Anaerotignum sp.]